MKIQEIINNFVDNLSKIYSREEAGQISYLVLSDVLKLSSKIDFMFRKDETVEETILPKLDRMLEELKNNRPVQYVLGHTFFYSLDLFVDESVLIPRPETEELIDWIVKDFNNKNKHVNILDIGTGSSCIAIALKKSIKDCNVLAVDVSQKALETAKRNSVQNNLEINLIQGDILNVNSIPDIGKFDIIVSNPPYVRHSEKELMNRNVLDYEPHQALFVDDINALIFYEAIADYALKHLAIEGALYFEINENKGKDIVTLLDAKGFSTILKQDLNGKDRMIMATLGR